jgi:hypothetical protein
VLTVCAEVLPSLGCANSTPARLRQSNRDGLFGGSRSMFPFADVMHLFAHEFSRLRARRFSFFSVAVRSFASFFFRHFVLLLNILVFELNSTDALAVKQALHDSSLYMEAAVSRAMQQKP